MAAEIGDILKELQEVLSRGIDGQQHLSAAFCRAAAEVREADKARVDASICLG